MENEPNPSTNNQPNKFEKMAEEVNKDQILDLETKQIMKEKGIPLIELKHATPEEYSEALDAGIDNNPHGVMVWRHPAEEIKDDTLLLIPDGSAGARVSQDGEIGSIFKNPALTSERGLLPALTIAAIAEGGTKGECYGEGTMQKYIQLGFIPVARTKWSEKDLQNGSTWNEEFGRPDMYFFIHNGKSAKEVAEGYGEQKAWTEEELEALPYLGYDGETPEAYAYRDACLAGDQETANSILEKFNTENPQ